MNYENKGYLFFSSIHSLFMIRYLIKKMLTFQNFWDHWSLKTEAIALDEIENCYAIIIIINNNYYYNHNLIAIIIIETWCTVATVFQKYIGQKCTGFWVVTLITFSCDTVVGVGAFLCCSLGLTLVFIFCTSSKSAATAWIYRPLESGNSIVNFYNGNSNRLHLSTCKKTSLVWNCDQSTETEVPISRRKHKGDKWYAREKKTTMGVGASPIPPLLLGF